MCHKIRNKKVCASVFCSAFHFSSCYTCHWSLQCRVPQWIKDYLWCVLCSAAYCRVTSSHTLLNWEELPRPFSKLRLHCEEENTTRWCIFIKDIGTFINVRVHLDYILLGPFSMRTFCPDRGTVCGPGPTGPGTNPIRTPGEHWWEWAGESFLYPVTLCSKWFQP